MLNALISHITRFTPIDPARLAVLENYVEPRHYRRKEWVLTEGRRCTEKYFVVKGMLQLCYLKANGGEQTVDFALENWWASDFMAFAGGTPSQFSIRAVEDSAVLCLTAGAQQALLSELPELHAYFHLLFQKAYAASQRRMRLLYELSKEELYQQFSREFPGFLQRVPQYLLAGFLGFTPEYLSEIRRKKLS